MSHSSSTLPAGLRLRGHKEKVVTDMNKTLIDTSFLTAEEKRVILNVIEEDIKYNKETLCSLEIAVYNGRQFQSLQSDSSKKTVLCSCCGLARTICDKFKGGYQCFQCGSLVCKRCIAMGTKKIICNICYKERLLDLQMRDFDLSNLNGEKKDSLYGSELLQISLKQVPKKDTTAQIFNLEPNPPKRSRANSLQKTGTIPNEMEYRHINVPSIDDPNSGFKLIKVSTSEENLAEISSLYSEPCYTDHPVTGEVSFAVWYREDESTLYVRIVKVKNLGTVQGNVVNPYIKTYLLPGKSKHTKRKTAIQRKTANPEYNEIIKYKMSTESISGTMLWLSVWNWNINGRNQFLGEVRFPLTSIDLTDPKVIKYQLCDKEEETEETDAAQSNGRLCIALKFEPLSRKSKSPTPTPVAATEEINLAGSLESRRLHKVLQPITDATQRRHSDLSTLRPLSNLELGKLWIRVKSAENLLSIDTTGNNNPFVRCFLLPKTSLASKKKTKVVKKSLDPVWDEEFFYNFISCDELSTNRVLEVTVWDNDRRGENSFMGGLRIGPDFNHQKPGWMDSTGEEVTHWQEMLDNQGGWVERWHTLRPSMKSLITGNDNLEGEVAEKSSDIIIPESSDIPTYSGDNADGTAGTEGEGFKVLPKPLELNLTRREKGDHYEISGSVIIAMDYKNDRLTVKVCKALGLAGVNKNKTASNPYIKLYLLPDRHSKVKSKPKKKTLNPTFDQLFKFRVSKRDLNDSSLWVTLWSHEGRFKHNQFLGETCIPFETHEFSDSPEEIPYKLSDYTKVDTIPNPALSRRRSTVYRVRAAPRRAQQDDGQDGGGGDIPTLYDSSLDLTATLDDSQAVKSDNEEKPFETDIDAELIPEISITSPIKSDDESIHITSSTSVIEKQSDSNSTLQSEQKPAAVSEKSSATKTPKTSDNAAKTLSNKRPPPQPISKAKYTTISASTKPSKSRKIQTATSTPKQASASKQEPLKEVTTEGDSSVNDGRSTTPDFLLPQRSIKQGEKSERNDSIISIHGNLI